MAEIFRKGSDPKEVVAALSRKLGSERIDVISFAAILGWKVVVTTTESATIISPVNEDKKIHIHRRSPNPKRMRSQIIEWGDPMMVRAAEGLATSDITNKELGQALQVMSDLSSEVQIVIPEDQPQKERYVKPAAVVPTPREVAAKVKKERHVISERPALMHYSLTNQGGKSYPSRTTMERRWSDGAVDYVCAVSTCGSVSENRRAFGGPHWAMHVRKGEAQPVDDPRSNVVDDPTYTEPAWTRKSDSRSKRMQALTALIKGLDMKTLTPEDLAEKIVEFLGDQGGGGSSQSEPLTAEQTLERIRTLVDRGTYTAQEQEILDRDKQIEQLLSYAEVKEAEMAERTLEAEQRAAKAEAHLQALRELVNEKVGE